MEIVGRLSVSVETIVETSLTRNVLTEALARNGLFRVYSLQDRVFGEPMASKGLQLWLHYSGFQASCYNTFCTDLLQMHFQEIS
jgi:hypothetical protein